MSPLSKMTNPGNTSQFKLVKNSTSNRVNALLIHNTIPITLHAKLVTFRDTGKKFELKGDLWKMIINKNYSVDLASLADKKIMYDFEKEMDFDVKATVIYSRSDTYKITLITRFNGFCFRCFKNNIFIILT